MPEILTIEKMRVAIQNTTLEDALMVGEYVATMRDVESRIREMVTTYVSLETS